MPDDSGDRDGNNRKLDRRGFLKATGALAVAAGLVSGCDAPPPTRRSISSPMPPLPEEAPTSRVPGPYEAVPQTPSQPPDPQLLEFFTLEEARTVDALAATILPGTPDDPGAREAGVLNYIDHLLAHEHGFAQPIYRSAPFAEPYSGEQPPQQDPNGPQPIWVKDTELPRYGYQSSLTPREIYRQALPMIDSYSRQNFGSNYVDLNEADQESVMQTMADSPEQIFGSGRAQRMQGGQGSGPPGTAQGGAANQPQQGQSGGTQEETGFHAPALTAFFEVLRTHVIEGMFSDPLYGGNREMAGWRLVGFPGAQRAYTPVEMRTEGLVREPQSIANLPHFHPGQPANEFVILPVSGSNRKRNE